MASLKTGDRTRLKTGNKTRLKAVNRTGLITTKKGKLSTSHRYNLLSLLSSDPGEVGRELVVYDFPVTKVVIFRKIARGSRKLALPAPHKQLRTCKQLRTLQTLPIKTPHSARRGPACSLFPRPESLPDSRRRGPALRYSLSRRSRPVPEPSSETPGCRPPRNCGGALC